MKSRSRRHDDDLVLEGRLRLQAQLLDAVGQAVLAADANGRVTYWNTAAARLYGLPRKQVIDRPLVRVMVRADRRAELGTIVERCLAGSAWSGELQIFRDWEGEVPALVSLTPLFAADGAVHGLVAVAVDLTDREHNRSLLAESERRAVELVEQLRRVNAHLRGVREQEQTRIAREMHDELGQLLTALKLEVSALQRRGKAREALAGDALGERLAVVGELADRTLDAVHRIGRHLRPPVLDDLGLAAAVDWLCKDFSMRSGVRCTQRIDLAGLPPDDGRDTEVFHIVQEALTNVARHARARNVRVAVVVAGSQLSVVVRDDGEGLPAAAAGAPGSLGLTGMRERAVACGGVLTVEAVDDDGGGTQVTARLPIRSVVLAELPVEAP
jgi:PAS domain S-box-containing protein